MLGLILLAGMALPSPFVQLRGESRPDTTRVVSRMLDFRSNKFGEPGMLSTIRGQHAIDSLSKVLGSPEPFHRWKGWCFGYKDEKRGFLLRFVADDVVEIRGWWMASAKTFGRFRRGEEEAVLRWFAGFARRETPKVPGP